MAEDVKAIEAENRRKKRREKKEKQHDRICKIYGITPSTMPEGTNRLHIITIVLRKRLVWLGIMTFFVALGVITYSYMQSLDMAKATIMLNYGQSAKGLAPNDTRFNISEFKSDEVMNAAILSAGLEGVVTSDELAENIGLFEIVNRKPVNESNYYIPTSYKVYYSNSEKIKNINAIDMIQVICNAYKEFFHNKYTVNSQVLAGDYSDIDSMEYAQISSLISMRLDEIWNFLDMRNNEGGKFRSSETGETFSSLKKLIENERNYALESFNSYIWENGIVKYRQTYIDTVQYKNDNYFRDKTEAFNEYSIRREVIGKFNNIMSTSVLVPTVNDREFYMARTKTGVDHLASQAEFYLESSKALELKIQKGEDRLMKIGDNTLPETIQTAENMIANMRKDIQHIEKLSLDTDMEYMEETSRDFITCQYHRMGLMERISRKLVLSVSALFFVLAFFVYYKECSLVMKVGGAK